MKHLQIVLNVLGVFCIVCIGASIESSCNQNSFKQSNFYYAGKQKIEITISKDTFGVVIRDTLQNPLIDKQKADSIKRFSFDFSQLGYTTAGELKPGTILLKSSTTTKNLSDLDKKAHQLKAAFQGKIVEAGYLARVKKSNDPLLITDEILVRFKPGTDTATINNIFAKYNLSIRKRNQFLNLLYTVAVTAQSSYDVIKTSHKLHDEPGVLYAELNFIYFKRPLSDYPNDTFFKKQWGLVNTGNDQSIAVEDADIDADKAWEFAKGNSNTIIAIVDVGFDVLQEDLKQNFAVNLLETPWDNSDDLRDANSYADDTIGWNFESQNNNLFNSSSHGTSVSGIAAARGNNDTGVIGSCPECGILPIVDGGHPGDDVSQIEYIIERGARIINYSVEYPREIGFNSPFKEALVRAIRSGVLIVWALSNGADEYCACDQSICTEPACLDSILTVSRSNSMDTYDCGGYGNCLDILAPSSIHPERATPSCPVYLKVTTTDIMNDGGYCFLDPPGSTTVRDGQTGCTEPFHVNYTGCFSGTSAAAPLVAGVAGLIRSLNPGLTPMQIEYLLQDCADKIDTSSGHYSKKTGYFDFECPYPNGTGSKTGYGRINAFEAIKIVSSDAERGGRNGIDVFVRDNILDWGNTEQPSNVLFNGNPRGSIGHYRSQDIKVNAPNGTGSPPTNSIEFENFVDEQPIANQVNKVYVRVHNRGHRRAAHVDVKLYWVYGGTVLPPLWNGFPNDAPTDATWYFLGSVSLTDLEYSGASVAYTSSDRSQIASFDFPAPLPTSGMRNHYCLAAFIDSPEDPLNVSGLDAITLLDDATPRFNNITHRNYSIISSTDTDTSGNTLLLHNPYAYPVSTLVKFDGAKNLIRRIDNIYVDCVFVMRPKESRRITIYFNKQPINHTVEFTVRQEIILNEKKKRKVIGGYSFIFTQ